MFIYSKFSSYGVETPEKLVHLLANEGIQALCLIDELGLGLNAFLHTCKKRNIRASIAIPFSSFVEGETEKATGYFVVSSCESYKLVTEFIETMKQDFIPIFTQEHLIAWSHQGIYCLLRAGNYCTEYQSQAKLKVVPVAYETEEVKQQARNNATPIVGISLEESYFAPDTVIFVEGISRCPHEFLEALKPNQKTVDLTNYRQKRQQLLPFKWFTSEKKDTFF